MNQIEKIIDIATWNRKEHFEHFSAFDDPFFRCNGQCRLYPCLPGSQK